MSGGSFLVANAALHGMVEHWTHGTYGAALDFSGSPNAGALL
jgi:hypothetical protein